MRSHHNAAGAASGSTSATDLDELLSDGDDDSDFVDEQHQQPAPSAGKRGRPRSLGRATTKRPSATKRRASAATPPTLRTTYRTSTHDEWFRRASTLPPATPGLWHLTEPVPPETADGHSTPPRVNDITSPDWWFLPPFESGRIRRIISLDPGPVHLAAACVDVRTGAVVNLCLFNLARWRPRKAKDLGIGAPTDAGANRRMHPDPWGAMAGDRDLGTLEEARQALQACMRRCPDAWDGELLVVERQKPAIVNGRASPGASSTASTYTRALAQWLLGHWHDPAHGRWALELGQTPVQTFFSFIDMDAASGAGGTTAELTSAGSGRRERAQHKRDGSATTGQTYGGNKMSATSFLAHQAQACPRLRECVHRERRLRRDQGRTCKGDDMGDALRMAWYVAYVLRRKQYARNAVVDAPAAVAPDQ